MIKLISIELKKIFKHKSIYLILLIMLIFCLINNILYKVDYDDEGNYKYESSTNLNKESEKLESELKAYNLENDNEKNMYITIKSKLDIIKIQTKYPKNTWQHIKCNDYLYEDIYNINYYQYVAKDQDNLTIAINNYHKKLKYFTENNWQYFIYLEKNNLNNQKQTLEIDKNKTNDKETEIKLDKEIKKIENDLTIINYRLTQNISYANTYLNKALTTYSEILNSLDDVEISSYKDKLNYNINLNELNINKYIIENKQNINKQNNLNYQLRTIIDDYELFIIIIILIITSILIGEEFNKGTIKLLLIKPFTRTKIILSKYITGLIIILLTIIFMIIIQLIIGGLLFNFDSLKIPVVVYNFTSSKIEVFNIFNYMLIRILVKLPMLVMILTISFTLGILITNTVAPFAITILLYSFSEVINSIIINYNLKFMKYFITINWNFKDYLFGGLPNFEYISLKKSILIYIIYVIILLYVMFKSFNKKNIKNI